MSRFLSGDHCKIVVKTQWTDIERHFQVLCGHCLDPRTKLNRLIRKEPG